MIFLYIQVMIADIPAKFSAIVWSVPGTFIRTANSNMAWLNGSDALRTYFRSYT